jgi:hypothetical protein
MTVLLAREQESGDTPPYFEGDARAQAELERKHADLDLQMVPHLPELSTVACLSAPRVFNPFTSSQPRLEGSRKRCGETHPRGARGKKRRGTELGAVEVGNDDGGDDSDGGEPYFEDPADDDVRKMQFHCVCVWSTSVHIISCI